MANTLEGVLMDATKIPACVEGKLPAGAPKLSQALSSFAGIFRTLPALPFNVPALPNPGASCLPTAPAPAPPAEAAALARMRAAAALQAGTTQQTAEKGSGPLPEVIVRRGM